MSSITRWRGRRLVSGLARWSGRRLVSSITRWRGRRLVSSIARWLGRRLVFSIMRWRWRLVCSFTRWQGRRLLSSVTRWRRQSAIPSSFRNTRVSTWSLFWLRWWSLGAAFRRFALGLWLWFWFGRTTRRTLLGTSLSLFLAFCHFLSFLWSLARHFYFFHCRFRRRGLAFFTRWPYPLPTPSDRRLRCE